MTPREALELVDQMRLQVTATGAVNDQIREAVATLWALVEPEPDRPAKDAGS